MNPETRLKDDLMRKLKAAYPAAFFFRTGAGPFMQAGCPDILGVWFGRFVGIEVKTPGKYKNPLTGCTPSQLKFGCKITEAGGFWFCTDDTTQCMAQMRIYEKVLMPKEVRGNSTGTAKQDGENRP